jgi:DNA-binding response OmpR family regulator
MAATVLIVDDHATVRDVVARYLQRQGFETIVASDGEAAIQQAVDADLLILDLMLPGIDGFEVCRRIRAQSAVPIIMLTAKGRIKDKVAGLGIGADDYVVKPFSPSELVARVRSALRRSGLDQSQDTLIHIGALRINVATRIVEHGTRILALTEREYDLLIFLAQHAGRVFSRMQLFHEVWGYNDQEGAEAVTVYVRRLRRKIEQDGTRPSLLKTVWGVGYTLSE